MYQRKCVGQIFIPQRLLIHRARALSIAFEPSIAVKIKRSLLCVMCQPFRDIQKKRSRFAPNRVLHPG